MKLCIFPVRLWSGGAARNLPAETKAFKPQSIDQPRTSVSNQGVDQILVPFVYGPKETSIKRIKCCWKCRKNARRCRLRSNHSPTLASTNEALMEKQWKTRKTATEDAAWKELGKTSKQLKEWISAIALQLLAKSKETRLSGSLEHRRLRVTTSSTRKDHERYRMQMTWETEIACETDDFGRLFRLTCFTLNEGYATQQANTRKLRDGQNSGLFLKRPTTIFNSTASSQVSQKSQM